MKQLRAALFAVTALSLCATTQAQWSWTQRWNTSSTYDDAAVASAVDHRGNLFTVGWTKEFNSPYRDLVVIKYDSAGNRLWVRNYHSRDGSGSPYAGDTVGTSIAVDWEGNCYASGVGYSGTTRNNDFVVIKYDPSGAIVWPTSGTHSSPDYDFDNGAIRLSDSANDGVWNTEPVSCDLGILNIPGDTPTFAITGPSVIGTATKWRTVAFSASRTTGVGVQGGWPVDDFGSVSLDKPFAVAIHTDNSVYVTGGVHFSGAILDEQMTTVRYKAGGTNNADPRYWTDYWDGDVEGKPSHGVDIALDYDGNAFVTGSLWLGGGITEVGTRKILKDPDSNGDPQHGWTTDPKFSPTDGASPASISLSFEVESGVLKTYTYVTGEMHRFGLGTGGDDVFGLRYKPDGTNATGWPVSYGAFANDDYGLHILGAGKGNAYITGSTLAPSHAGDRGGDYLLLGYRKDNTQRFTAATYDNSGIDEAHYGALGGAGLAYCTGRSEGSSTAKDFATNQHIETATSSNPSGGSGYVVQAGTYSSGSVSSLTSDDSSYLIVAATTTGRTPVVFVTFEGVVSTDATELSIHLKGQVTGTGATGVREKVEVFDLITNSYVMISDHDASVGSDAPVSLPLKNDPAQYIDGSGNVKIRVSYYGGTSSSWSAKYNLVRWDIIGT